MGGSVPAHPVVGCRRPRMAAAPWELPRDPAFPQLPVILDAGAMQERFQALPGFDGLVIEQCAVEYVRYRPGMDCLAGYRLRVRGPDGDAGDQVLTGRLSADPSAVPTARFYKMRGRPAYGPPCAYLPDLGMVVTAFPNDRVIRRLDRLWRPRSLHRTLERAVPGLQDGACSVPLRGIRVELMSYKPERRCLVACRLDVHHPASGERTRWSLLGRMYADESGAEVYRVMQVLSNLKDAGGFTVGVARPLGYDADTRTLFQSRERGQPLSGVLGTPDGVRRLPEVAAGLASLHLGPVQVGRQTDPLGELESFYRLGRAAAAVHSPATRLSAVIARLGQRADHVRGTPVAVHGDFTPDNVLAHGRTITFIDFDWAAMGDPASDVASFSGSLGQLGADGIGTLAGAEAEFCRMYERRNPFERFEERLRWYRALFFVKRSLEALWSLESGWRDRMERYCQLAEHEL